MSGQFERTQPGYRDNLSPWQQQCLFELWSRFFRLCQTPASPETAAGAAAATTATPAPSFPRDEAAAEAAWKASLPNSADHSASASASASTASSSARPQQQTSAPHSKDSLSHSYSMSNLESSSAAATAPTDECPVKVQVQGQHEAKEMRTFLEKYGGNMLRKVFWEMVKGEHPDAVMLRLLRARKWSVDRAVAVLGSTAAWRVENNVNAVAKGGELELTRTRGGMNILHNGVSYMHGATANGEPVYIIEVGNHFSSSQTQDELKRAVILLQETLGSLMPPPVERKIVIFNLNNFSVRNMDWWCVFFMVKTMECFYVETLARVYLHGAPWIFKPIWSILKPLLDPVVRDKIRLTSDAKELEEYIPWDHLPKGTMKGGMDWEFQYPLPTPAENDIQKDTATCDALQEQYFSVCFQLERATKAVTRVLTKAQAQSARQRRHQHQQNTLHQPYDRHHPPHQDFDDAASFVGGAEWDEPEELAALKAKRDVLATKLRVVWLKLRPYMMGKTMVHRWDAVQPDGTIVWHYPKLDGSVETQVLGEATSLPALEANLAAIEQSISTDTVSSRPRESRRQQQQHRSSGAWSGVAPVVGDGAGPSSAAQPSEPPVLFSGGALTQVRSNGSVLTSTSANGNKKASRKSQSRDDLDAARRRGSASGTSVGELRRLSPTAACSAAPVVPVAAITASEVDTTLPSAPSQLPAVAATIPTTSSSAAAAAAAARPTTSASQHSTTNTSSSSPPYAASVSESASNFSHAPSSFYSAATETGPIAVHAQAPSVIPGEPASSRAQADHEPLLTPATSVEEGPGPVAAAGGEGGLAGKLGISGAGTTAQGESTAVPVHPLQR